MTTTHLFQRLWATIKRGLVAFKNWLARNAKAHADAKTSACCAAPPPGANQGRKNKN